MFNIAQKIQTSAFIMLFIILLTKIREKRHKFIKISVFLEHFMFLSNFCTFNITKKCQSLPRQATETQKWYIHTNQQTNLSLELLSKNKRRTTSAAAHCCRKLSSGCQEC